LQLVMDAAPLRVRKLPVLGALAQGADDAPAG
jgi:hypothetical protein